MRGIKPFFASIARKIKKIGKLLPHLFGKDFSVFLLFLGISFVFWWTRTMSRSYEMHIQYPVQLVDIPEKLRITDIPEYELKLIVSGKGMSLWTAKQKFKKPLLIRPSDFIMSSGHASLSTHHFTDSIEGFLSTSLTLKGIEPDSLFFNYSIQKKKKIPVQFSGTTEGHNQYVIEKVTIIPDSILVSYPVEMNDSVLVLRNESINISINDDTTIVSAKLEEIPGVTSDVSKVNISVIASQYTEKSFTVPIVGINFPNGKILKSFPSKAEVTFWVKLSDFEKIKDSDFKLVVDYNEITNESDRASVRIFCQPSDITNVRINPTSISFLIEDIRTYYD